MLEADGRSPARRARTPSPRSSAASRIGTRSRVRLRPACWIAAAMPGEVSQSSSAHIVGRTPWAGTRRSQGRRSGDTRPARGPRIPRASPALSIPRLAVVALTTVSGVSTSPSRRIRCRITRLTDFTYPRRRPACHRTGMLTFESGSNFMQVLVRSTSSRCRTANLSGSPTTTCRSWGRCSRRTGRGSRTRRSRRATGRPGPCRCRGVSQRALPNAAGLPGLQLSASCFPRSGPAAFIWGL